MKYFAVISNKAAHESVWHYVQQRFISTLKKYEKLQLTIGQVLLEGISRNVLATFDGVKVPLFFTRKSLWNHHPLSGVRHCEEGRKSNREHKSTILLYSQWVSASNDNKHNGQRLMVDGPDLEHVQLGHWPCLRQALFPLKNSHITLHGKGRNDRHHFPQRSSTVDLCVDTIWCNLLLGTK